MNGVVAAWCPECEDTTVINPTIFDSDDAPFGGHYQDNLLPGLYRAWFLRVDTRVASGESLRVRMWQKRITVLKRSIIPFEREISALEARVADVAPPAETP